MKIWALVASLLLAGSAWAEIQDKTVTWRANGITFQGRLMWDDAQDGKRPGVLVVHEWWGLNDYTRERARMLAGQGYAALAVDMYGEGKSTTHPEEATAYMQQALADADAFRARFVAAKGVLEQQPMVDSDKIAAIGYCFGGATVLNMARQGVDLDLVASFHGLLATETPAAKGEVKPRVLVFHGEADPMVPASDVAAFKQEMEAADVDYAFYGYPGAKHAFTNPAADAKSKEMPAVGYDPQADRDSWQKLLKALEATFGEPDDSRPGTDK